METNIFHIFNFRHTYDKGNDSSNEGYSSTLRLQSYRKSNVSREIFCTLSSIPIALDKRWLLHRVDRRSTAVSLFSKPVRSRRVRDSRRFRSICTALFSFLFVPFPQHPSLDRRRTHWSPIRLPLERLATAPAQPLSPMSSPVPALRRPEVPTPHPPLIRRLVGTILPPSPIRLPVRR